MKNTSIKNTSIKNTNMEKVSKKLITMCSIMGAINTNNPSGLSSLLKTAKSNGINIDTPISDGNGGFIPILHLSVGLGYLEIVKILIKNNADVNVPNEVGHLPLHLAISGKLTDMALLLIDNGANVNALHVSGLSPLITAIENNCTEIAIKLIDNGANINEDVIKINKDIKIKINALNSSIMLEDIDVFNKLLECNVEINSITSKREIYSVSLDLAIHKKNKYMINTLLENKNIDKCRKKSIDCIVCYSNIDISWCSKCNIIGYCSIECQKKDWPIHKLYCQHITRLSKRK